MAKKKFYVVWNGHTKGVFDNWNTCKKSIEGYQGAQYKSFADKESATIAFSKSYNDYKGIDTSKPKPSQALLEQVGTPNLSSISVDAACSGNPGKMEYRGVDTASKKQLFIQGPFDQGTNNIGEFLALVHGLAFLQQHKKYDLPIYSDSRIAIGWVKAKQCRTKVMPTAKNKVLYDMIKRAEKWLHTHSYKNPILKWETKAWGEIPADFGRK